jgi:DNA processing protein
MSTAEPPRRGPPTGAGRRPPALPPAAYVASLLGLSGMTPARLGRVLEGRSPEQAWGRVREGAALSSDGTQPGDGATGGQLSLAAGDAHPADEGDPEGLGAPWLWGGEGGGPAGSRGSGARGPKAGRDGERPWRQQGPAPPRRRQQGPEADAALNHEWAKEAARTDPAEVLARYQRASVSVHLLGWPSYPSLLLAEVKPPPVICTLGDLSCLEKPRVALVGTRSCTHYGEEVAAELGAELSRWGVVVVSGLARGIDGAAHEGALAGWEAGGAPPVGVTGSGLDIVYPPGHARLWARVAQAGALLSEAPLGARPEAWRFPWRNRLLAALAQVVVVVESHAGGGSMLTVEAAARRGVPVMAVPGSIRSPASAGTNGLLADGCAPVRDADDVLAALGLAQSGAGPGMAGGLWLDPGAGRSGSRTSPDGGETAMGDLERAVLTAVSSEPTAIEDILRRSGAGLGQAAGALDRLEEAGLVRRGDGWWERANPSTAGRR